MTLVEMNSEKSIEFAYKISNIYYFPEKKTMDTIRYLFLKIFEKVEEIIQYSNIFNSFFNAIFVNMLFNVYQDHASSIILF